MARYQVPDNVLNALIQQESGGNHAAVSRKGARGLTQIMPETARNPGYGINPLRDNSPEEAKRFTRDYLGTMVDKTGSLESGLAAYNAGLGPVLKAGGVPNIPETQNYVQKIMGSLNPISTASADETPYKPSFEEWLAANPEPQQLEQPAQPVKPSFEEWLAANPEPSVTEQPTNALAWSDVPGQALSNLPKSAGEFASGIGEAVMNPIETGKNIAGVVRGGMQNMLPDSVANWLIEKGITPESRPIADAIGTFYKDRYGSEEGFKQAIANDPVGVMADISTVAGGVGGAAKLGGLSKTASVANKLSNITNPITAVNKIAGAAGQVAGVVSDPLLGLTTGAGTASIKAAREAGKAGGSKSLAFTENMRGNVPIDEVLGEAKGALKTMGSERGANYRAGMADVGVTQRVLPFNNIDSAVNRALTVGTFKGESVNKSALVTQKAIQKQVNKWKSLDPAEYHTAEGLDALKKSIGDIRDSSEYGSPSRNIADGVYNAIKNEIIKEAPEYKAVMGDYENSIKLQHEIERALSLNDKASADTAIRKLQSLTRNNVNTNFGNRVKLANQLEGFGAENLLTKISGQALNSITPRGLQSLAASGLGGAAVALQNPLLASGLLLQSPRLVGEFEHAAGKTSRVMNNKLTRAAKRAAPIASVSGNIKKRTEK